jgi:hypothetical protein
VPETEEAMKAFDQDKFDVFKAAVVATNYVNAYEDASWENLIGHGHGHAHGHESLNALGTVRERQAPGSAGRS